MMGVVVSMLGMYFSVLFYLPTGAAIVCTFGLVLVVMAILRPLVVGPQISLTKATPGFWRSAYSSDHEDGNSSTSRPSRVVVTSTLVPSPSRVWAPPGCPSKPRAATNDNGSARLARLYLDFNRAEITSNWSAPTTPTDRVPPSRAGEEHLHQALLLELPHAIIKLLVFGALEAQPGKVFRGKPRNRGVAHFAPAVDGVANGKPAGIDEAHDRPPRRPPRPSADRGRTACMAARCAPARSSVR